MNDNLNRPYAEHHDESYLVKKNHKSRQETILYNPERKRKVEERQRHYSGFANKAYPQTSGLFTS